MDVKQRQVTREEEQQEEEEEEDGTKRRRRKRGGGGFTVPMRWPGGICTPENCAMLCRHLRARLRLLTAALARRRRRRSDGRNMPCFSCRPLSFGGKQASKHSSCLLLIVAGGGGGGGCEPPRRDVLSWGDVGVASFDSSSFLLASYYPALFFLCPPPASNSQCRQTIDSTDDCY